MCLQETKLHSAQPTSCLNIDEYDVFRRDRNVHGGGVCIYVRSCFKAKSINCNSTKEIVGINILNGNVAIFSVYKPPNSNPDEFYKELTDIVTSQSDQQSTIIIAGDTNMNMFDASKKNKVTQYCTEMNVIEWVDKATHLDSCIDHIMVTKGINVTNLQLLSPTEKRHATITCEIILPEQNARQPNNSNQDSKITVKCWKKASWEEMKSWLLDQNLVNQITDELSIENGWLIFKEKCLMAIELFVPEVCPRRKKRTWLSIETKCAIRKREYLFKKWKCSNRQEDRGKFEKARKGCKKMVAKDRKTWITKTFNTDDVRKFWKAVRMLKSGNDPTLEIPDLIENGTVFRTQQEKAEILRMQYEKTWNCDSTDLSLESGPPDNSGCAISWVNKQLRGLNPNKATGPDNIPALFLKQMASVLSAPIATLINKTWKEGIIPNDWKKATIIPIPKVRSSPHSSDYRPISLTCVVGKIAERFVLSNIYEVIDKELPQQQFGFRRNRGTIDALIEAEHRIMAAMEDCTGSPTRVAVISFDISKAFDTVSHKRLIEHLRSSFQLPLNARRWIQAFLVGRVQRVKVGAAFSKWSTISSGVPQGTVLGPVLYNAATAGIKKIKLSEGSHIILYADDLLLIKPIKTQNEEEELQKYCHAIEAFYK